MAIESYNPYEAFAEKFTDGLDYIIAHPPAGAWTMKDLNQVVLDYLISIDPDNDILAGMVSTLIPNTANDYINSNIAANLNADDAQYALIDAILCGIKDNTIDSLDKFWSGANEQLAMSQIDTIDKTSLYVAIAISEASTVYWNNIVTTPGDWATHLSSNAAINYANIPAYVSASFVGSLSGFAQIKDTDVKETTDLGTFFGIFGGFGGLASALGLTAGKILFKWAKRPVVDCGCEG